MKKVFLQSMLAASVLMSGQALAASGQVEWGYSGEKGAENWGQLAPQFATCSSGKNQSPIDISGAVEAELKPLELAYTTAPNEIVNNGHTIQVNIAAGSKLLVDGKEFELKQYHFHTPSENKVSGKAYPFEVHLVHADAQGNLAVVGVFFEYGESNQTLAALWQQLPKQAGESVALKDVAMNVADILPAEQDYYRFTGSLTTPPCSEGVRWFVMQQPVSASKQQVADFLAAVKHENARPVQHINARKVIKND